MNAIDPAPIPDESVHRAIEHYKVALAAIHRLDMEMYDWIGKEIGFMHGRHPQQGIILDISADLFPRELRVLNVRTGTVRWIHIGRIIAYYEKDSPTR